MAYAKDSIVVKNQFTTKYKAGYGSTVGVFFAKYINREDATESLLPNTTNDLESILLRYDNRKQITKSAIRGKYDLSYLHEHLSDKSGGRAFSNEKISLSSDDVVVLSQMLQDLWSDGHTVQKMVVSFRLDYLKDLNIVPQDLKINKRGDYKGHVDQLKLRLALQNTLKDFTKDYVNPVYVGAIQLDTLQVHAHILIVDNCDLSKSNRLVKRDGIWQERGKYRQSELNNFKTTLNYQLELSKDAKSFYLQPVLEHENIYNNMSTLTSRYYSTDIQLQRILLSLPKDKDLWYMACDDKSMIYPKKLVSEYVDDSIKTYDKALHFDELYNKLRTKALKMKRPLQYLQQQVNKVKTKLGDSVLSTLKNVVDTVTTATRSNFLKFQARSNNEIKRFAEVTKNGWVKFNYKLDKFKNRLKKHLDSFDDYSQQIAVFDLEAQTNNVSDEAYDLRNYYEIQRDYHAALVDKYHYFLPYTFAQGNLSDYQKRQEQLNQKYEVLINDLQNRGELVLAEVNENIAHSLLNDNSLSAFVNTRLSNDTTIGQQLLSKLKDKRYTYSDDFIEYISLLEKSDIRYTGLSSFLGIEDKLSIHKLDSSIKIEDYLREANLLSLECFKEGLISYDRVINNRLKAFDDDLTKGVSQIRFNQVKAYDLHDLRDDSFLSTFGKFIVSDNNILAYENVVRQRFQATSLAADFLNQLGDDDKLIQAQAQLKELQEQSKLVLQLSSTNELQLSDADKLNSSSFNNLIERYDSTFSLTDASKINHSQMISMQKTIDNDMLELGNE